MKTKFLIIVFICIYSTINGQVSPFQAPPSHEAASLGKFVDVPVDQASGLPATSIPLFSVGYDDIALPITLDYHHQGIKVDELASNVGTGWALKYGGIIHRTIKSLPDDSATGYMTNTTPVTEASIGNATVDSEPDIFTFNFLGYEGKFVVDKSGTALISPFYNLDISFSNNFRQITIVDPMGTTYYFGDMSPDNNVDDGLEKSFHGGNISFANGFDPSEISAYYLVKIETLDKNVIDFTYERSSYSFKNLASCKDLSTSCMLNTNGSTGSFCTGNLTEGDKSVLETNIYGWRITYITTDDKEVKFIYKTKEREDLKAHDADISLFGTANALKAISLFNINKGTTQYTSRWNIITNYFQDPKTASGASDMTVYKRLKLESIKHLSSNSDPIIYSFDYSSSTSDDSFLINRLSREKDHWGYYNAATTNETSPDEPNIPASTSPCSNFTTSVGTSDRSVSPTNALSGSLERITFPTGGFKDFIMESNDVLTAGVVTSVGGLRVLQTKLSTMDGDPNPVIWDYAYLSDGVSSGQLGGYGIPSYSSYLFSGTTPTSASSCIIPIVGPTDFEVNWFSDQMNLPLDNFGGRQIGYTKVTITQPNNGQHIFDYSVENNIDLFDSSFPLTTTFPTTNTVTTVAGDPLVNYPLFTGGLQMKLVREQILDRDGNPVSKVDYLYKVVNKQLGGDGVGELVYKTVNWHTGEAFVLPVFLFGTSSAADIAAYSATVLSNAPNPAIGGACIALLSTSSMGFSYIPRVSIGLLDTKTTTIDGVESVETYKYNEKNQLIAHQTEGGKGEDIISLIKYPNDINKGIYADMVALNMHNYPIEQVQIKNDRIVNASLQTYEDIAPFNDVLIKPTASWVLESNGLMSTDEFDSIEGDASGNISYDNSYTRKEVYTYYDDLSLLPLYGNLKKTENPASGIETLFGWSDDGNYLRKVVIRDASIEDEDDVDAIEDNLRVIIYDYDDYNQLKITTDSNNQSTYYEYDRLGRLKIVKDHNEDYIKYIEYKTTH